MDTKKTIQRNLIKKARKMYKKIYPCGEKGKLNECFTYTRKSVVFWFNTKDETTHAIVDYRVGRQNS